MFVRLFVHCSIKMLIQKTFNVGTCVSTLVYIVDGSLVVWAVSLLAITTELLNWCKELSVLLDLYNKWHVLSFT